MRLNNSLDQHIAVFGESGSGKTVLLSSFYGSAQEPHFKSENDYHLIADDAGQGMALHQTYLGMKDSNQRPRPNKFAAKKYSFTVRPKAGQATSRSLPFDVMRLVWHDYPGEWFEQDASGQEEAQRRVHTFKSLLESDVALVLVDGERLRDNAGEEERYLKSLFTKLGNGLLSLKDDLLEDGKPLVKFPRIWVLALSKSDVHPDLDVSKFRDLVIRKAGEELVQLRKVLEELVAASDALSFGEDFVILSSARFSPGKIEVAERVGLDLILPLAAILPFERHARWNEGLTLPRSVAEELLSGAGALAALLVGFKSRLPGVWGRVLSLVGPSTIAEAAKMAQDRVRDLNKEAKAKGDFLRATLTKFKLDLEAGESKSVLLRSLR